MDIKNFKKECESAITNTEWCDFEHDYEVMQFYYEDHLFYKLFLNILLDDHKIKVEYKCSKDIIFYDFNKFGYIKIYPYAYKRKDYFGYFMDLC